MNVSLLTALGICETIQLQGCECMGKELLDVYEKLAVAEEQAKARKAKDAAEGLRASREKLRLAVERLASEIDKGWQPTEEKD